MFHFYKVTINFLLSFRTVNPLCFLLRVTGASHRQKLWVVGPIVFWGSLQYLYIQYHLRQLQFLSTWLAAALILSLYPATISCGKLLNIQLIFYLYNSAKSREVNKMKRQACKEETTGGPKKTNQTKKPLKSTEITDSTKNRGGKGYFFPSFEINELFKN